MRWITRNGQPWRRYKFEDELLKDNADVDRLLVRCLPVNRGNIRLVPVSDYSLIEARAFIEFELPSTGRKMVSAIDAALAAHRKES